MSIQIAVNTDNIAYSVFQSRDESLNYINLMQTATSAMYSHLTDIL